MPTSIIVLSRGDRAVLQHIHNTFLSFLLTYGVKFGYYFLVRDDHEECHLGEMTKRRSKCNASIKETEEVFVAFQHHYNHCSSYLKRF